MNNTFFSQWTGIIKRIVPLDDSSLGVGKTFHMHMSVPIGLKRYHTVVQSYKPGSLLALTIDMEFLHPTVVIEVNEDERPGMSKVTMRVYSSRRSYLFRVSSIFSRFFLLFRVVSSVNDVMAELSPDLTVPHACRQNVFC